MLAPGMVENVAQSFARIPLALSSGVSRSPHGFSLTMTMPEFGERPEFRMEKPLTMMTCWMPSTPSSISSIRSVTSVVRGSAAPSGSCTSTIR